MRIWILLALMLLATTAKADQQYYGCWISGWNLPVIAEIGPQCSKAVFRKRAVAVLKILTVKEDWKETFKLLRCGYLDIQGVE